MTGRVVDPPEVVEVDDREGQRLAVANGSRPLALHLFLEGAVVAEPGQGVAEGLVARPVVRVLEDQACALEAFGRFQDASREPDGEQPEQGRHAHDPERRQDQGRAPAPGQPVDDRCRDPDRDGEHGDQGEEQPQPDEPQVGRFTEQGAGILVVADGAAPR
jgi:hypothetical protein